MHTSPPPALGTSSQHTRSPPSRYARARACQCLCVRSVHLRGCVLDERVRTWRTVETLRSRIKFGCTTALQCAARREGKVEERPWNFDDVAWISLRLYFNHRQPGCLVYADAAFAGEYVGTAWPRELELGNTEKTAELCQPARWNQLLWVLPE